MITDIILIAVLVLIVGGAALYVYRAKKRGEACIGCPHSKKCGGGCGCSCSGEKK